MEWEKKKAHVHYTHNSSVNIFAVNAIHMTQNQQQKNAKTLIVIIVIIVIHLTAYNEHELHL